MECRHVSCHARSRHSRGALMSGLWWLEPGWKQSCCGVCGVNIWDSGGDPDHGVCFQCFSAQHEEYEDHLQAREECEKARLADLLNAEMVCRIRLHEAQRERAAAEEKCRVILDELNGLKRDAYALGFKGNIMRDDDGNRVNVLPDPRAALKGGEADE